MYLCDHMTDQIGQSLDEMNQGEDQHSVNFHFLREYERKHRTSFAQHLNLSFVKLCAETMV